MKEVILSIKIDGDGAPLRVSADPGKMTPEQRQTYDSLYQAYKAEKHAFWHSFNLRQRFFARRGPDPIAAQRDGLCCKKQRGGSIALSIMVCHRRKKLLS